jgi:hypothetical protein
MVKGTSNLFLLRESGFFSNKEAKALAMIYMGEGQ